LRLQIVGIALTCASAFAYSQMTHHGAFLEATGQWVTIVGMGVGLGMAALACCGIFGSIKAAAEGDPKRIPLLLYVYIAIVALLLLGQIFLVVASAGFRSSAEKDLRSNLGQAWNKTSDDNRQLVQKEFNCCGFLGPDDAPALPCARGKNNATLPGCWDDLRSQLDSNLLLLEISACIAGFVQILMLGFAIALVAQAKQLRTAASQPLLLYGHDGASLNSQGVRKTPWYAARS
jgi:Na+(H+)/acetate symporter ActP